MYDKDFKNVTFDEELEREFAEKPIGNFLYHIKGFSNIRLFIHLDETQYATFYCIYRLNKDSQKFEILDNELKTEDDLGRRINGNCYFQDLRCDRRLEHIGWEERKDPLCIKEKDFLIKLKPTK